MKFNKTVIVCFDGKISRGVFGTVLKSTQYKIVVSFPHEGYVEVMTFRKKPSEYNKRFVYGVNSSHFVVIPMSQMKSWYKSYTDTVIKNTQNHAELDGWDD